MENVTDSNTSLEINNSASRVLKDDLAGRINEGIFNSSKIAEGGLFPAEIDGEPCVGITVKNGDKKEGNTERAEITENNDILVPVGNEVWYGFSTYFPTDFKIEDNRLVFAQWKQKTEGDESPFLSLRYINGRLVVQVNSEDNKEKIFNEEIDLKGKWSDFKINYKLEKDGSGFAKVYLGDKLIAEYEGIMGYPYASDLTYFKMGLYRDNSETPQTIYLKDFKRGPTEESISDSL